MLSRIIYLEIHHNIVLNVLGIIRRERIGKLIYYVDLLDMSRVKTKRQKFCTWCQARLSLCSFYFVHYGLSHRQTKMNKFLWVKKNRPRMNNNTYFLVGLRRRSEEKRLPLLNYCLASSNRIPLIRFFCFLPITFVPHLVSDWLRIWTDH